MQFGSGLNLTPDLIVTQLIPCAPKQAHLPVDREVSRDRESHAGHRKKGLANSKYEGNSVDVKAWPSSWRIQPKYDKKLAEGPNHHSWLTWREPRTQWAQVSRVWGGKLKGWMEHTDSSSSCRWLWLQKRKRNFHVLCTACVSCTLYIDN